MTLPCLQFLEFYIKGSCQPLSRGHFSGPLLDLLSHLFYQEIHNPSSKRLINYFVVPQEQLDCKDKNQVFKEVEQPKLSHTGVHTPTMMVPALLT